ncbi:MAG: hypothetical protein FJZ01_16005 [Candidatus Sericytochromatia bacterium]|nr:hypothetical protein [Candidatus Tanganyikabacteria bacterium]
MALGMEGFPLAAISARGWLPGLVAVVLVLVAGCSLVGVAGRLAAMQPDASPAPGVTATLETVGPASVPASEPLPRATQKGWVSLAVTWPARPAGYRAQRIPDSTDRVLFEMRTAGNTLVASTSIARSAGVATATGQIEVDAGSYRLDATAQAGPAAAPVAVATASAPLTVVAGARTAASLTLRETYPPAVTGFAASWGLPGESVVLTGSNLGLSWAATPAVSFTGTNASLSATVTGITAGSVTVTVPAGAKTGRLTVNVDGSATDSTTFTVPSPALWALHSQIASAGDTIWLDGGFGNSVTVNFPGNVTAAATVLGPGRAKVVVPANATAGDLKVTTGANTSATLPFRAPTFLLGLGTLFGSHYDQASGGRRTPTLIVPRHSFASAVVGPYFYVVGGENDSGRPKSVERALIDGAGYLGPFEVLADVSLPSERNGFEAVRIGNRLYLVGSEEEAGVLRAPIDGAGNLGNFVPAGVSLTTRRHRPGVLVVGNYLYVIGGSSSGSRLASVERARIEADGGLSGFDTVPAVTLGTARNAMGIASVGSYLYVLGGSDGSPLGSIERAPIEPDGDLGAFQTLADRSLVAARSTFGTVVIGSKLYVVGGGGNSGRLGTVESAAFDTQGNLDAFQSVGASLGTARNAFGSAVVGNHLYAIGGSAPASLAGIERISLNESGKLGAFQAAGTLSAARFSFGSSIVGSRLYILGGVTQAGATSSVERASIDAAGGLGTFEAPQGVALTGNRYGHATARIGDYLYVLGGNTGVSSATNLASVERATIDASGSIGNFGAVSTSLATPRDFPQCAVIGGYLYAFGGHGYSGGVVVLNSVERSPITASGDLSGFSMQAGTLATARYSSGLAVIGSYVYLFGGTTAGGAILNSIERAAIGTDGGLGPFSTIPVTLGTARSHRSVAVIGDYVYVIGGEAGGPAIGTVERAAIGSSGDLGAFSPVPASSLGTPRFDAGAAVIGDYLYILGGRTPDPLDTIERARLQ